MGLYDPATGNFFLKNVNANGAADYVFSFGPANVGWKPVAGDWNGDGVDTIGLYDPSSGTFYLRNANSSGGANLTFSFGPAGWMPIAGDWNNDGIDTIGAFAPSTSEFYLRNQNSSGNADVVVQFGGAPSAWLPVAGDWSGAAAKAAGEGDGEAGKTAEVASVSWTEDYGYDRFGNRTDGVAITKTRNRINETGYAYDGPGNLLSEPAGPGTTKVYKYNAENKMWRAEIPNAPAATYVYDGEGRRVKKIVGTTVTRFVYGVNGELVAEYDGAGVLKKEYVYGPAGLLATIEGSVVKYVTPDHLGSPRVVTNGTGGVISRHDYLPFGAEIMAGTGGRTGTGLQGYSVADGIRQQFTSKERDAETGLDYFEARYCSSLVGRFTSIDEGDWDESVPQSLNRYAFVLNNPLRYVDPDGHAAQEAVAVSGGLAAAAGTGGAGTAAAAAGAVVASAEVAALLVIVQHWVDKKVEDAGYTYVTERRDDMGVRARILVQKPLPPVRVTYQALQESVWVDRRRVPLG